MLKAKITLKFTFLVATSLSLCQCATQEVSIELNQKMKSKGASYAQELAAQSPFKKVEMSWREASELMKERNPNYRQAILNKQESQIKRGLVNNFTYEVRKSLTDSVQTTLNPGEIAKSMKDPVGSLPRQLESITDLKNISHSLTQSEWGRVSQSVQADSAQRKEIVNLHVLFCQSENLENAAENLEKITIMVTENQSKMMREELAKAQAVLKKERALWLDQVRNFFNAEYYDVEFKDYQQKLSFYREIADPEFSDWKRWRILENSSRLASELQKQHSKSKPSLPGINRITQNLGVEEMRTSLGQQSVLNESMAKEVRQLLKNWRNLKSVQKKIVVSEPKIKLSLTDRGIGRQLGVADLKRVTEVYLLKKKEIEHLRTFWMTDEKCWVTENKRLY